MFLISSSSTSTKSYYPLSPLYLLYPVSPASSTFSFTSSILFTTSLLSHYLLFLFLSPSLVAPASPARACAFSAHEHLLVRGRYGGSHAASIPSDLPVLPASSISGCGAGKLTCQRPLWLQVILAMPSLPAGSARVSLNLTQPSLDAQSCAHSLVVGHHLGVSHAEAFRFAALAPPPLFGVAVEAFLHRPV